MRTVAFFVARALEAQGRSFDSWHADSLKPSQREVPHSVIFNTHIMTALVAVKLRSNIALLNKTKHTEPSKK